MPSRWQWAAPELLSGRNCAAKAKGIDLKPPFSLLATLLVAPIAWTSLQWATYSAKQNGEIKDAKSFKSQTFIFVGWLVITGVLLALLGAALPEALGTEFLYVAGSGYWSLIGEANIAGFNLWPPILAVALTASPIMVLLISVGYILNSFQIANNIMIGTTRIMVAASLDRAMPEWFSRVSERRHTPVNAHLAFFCLCSIPVIIAYNLVPGWIALTLGVTFGGGLGFAGTALAGVFFPLPGQGSVCRHRRARNSQVNPLHRYGARAGRPLRLVWAGWVLAPHAFASSPFLIWLTRTAVTVGGASPSCCSSANTYPDGSKAKDAMADRSGHCWAAV